MKNLFAAALALSFLVGMTGCQKTLTSVEKKSVTMKALYAGVPVTVDGRLEESVWKNAQEYTFDIPGDMAPNGEAIRESGQVRLAWDDRYFYVGIQCEDSDLVAEGKKDELRHFELGDLFELFLKPDNQSWYWELYVTPRGKKTSFFFPGCGRFGLPGCMDYQSGMKVAAQCQGTLDNWRDKDTGWTAEMAVPIKDLTAEGDAFGPGQKWRILVARYNYSRYFDAPRGPEYSMTPKLSQTNFHLLPEYAYLELIK
ncbi:MAG: carbohydrate-binding family 9-like protein [Planctomycetota bacterium]